MPALRLPAVTALFTLLALLFATSHALAAQPLTPTLIENWMASQKALQQWGAAHEDEIARYEEHIDMSQVNPMEFNAETMLKPLRASGLYSQAERIVKQHDFSSMESWAELKIRITKAAASIEMDQTPDAFDMSQIKAMMASGDFTPEQEAMMQQAIDQSEMMRKQLVDDINPADKKALQPYLNEIMRLMEEEVR